MSIASLYVDLVPTFQGIGQELRNGLVRPADQAGQNAGVAISKAVTAAALVGGAAAGAALVAGFNQAADFQEANQKLKAQLGIGVKESGRLGTIAGRLFAANYGDSLEDVNNALRLVIQNVSGMATASNASLQSITAQVITVASTFDQELGGVTAAVGQLMRTGMAPSAQVALDIITKGLQSSANKAGDFLDTINEYGTQFRKVGVDGATMTGILNQGLQAGARDADVIADAIKEFSIRAVDGSKTTAAGFKAIGLDAATMATQIAKGGPAARAGLDTVLDRLRAMKDPVAQSQAAVALFGTQAEDLGAALYAIDPSTATAGLGKLGGAAKQADADINGGVNKSLAQMQRQFTTSLSGLAVQALPVINAILVAINPLVPTLVHVAVAGAGLVAVAKGASLAKAGIDALVTGVGGLRTGVGAVRGFVQGFRNINLAFNSGATGAQTFGAAVRAGLGNTWRSLTTMATAARAAAAATWLNVRAAGAAALAWLRMGIQAQLASIRTAAAAVWTRVVSAATAVWTGIQWALNAAMAANPVGIIVLAVIALVAIVVLAYNKVGWFREGVQAAWAGIQAGAVWLWNFLQPFIRSFVAYLQWLGGIAAWLWKGIVAGWNLLIAAGVNLWNWLNNRVFTPLRTLFLTTIPNAVRTGVAGIKAWWDKLMTVARQPVQFVVDVVYNKGIVPVWNAIATKVGLGALKPLRFATGGVLPGYTPGRDIHLAALSGGEAVMRPEWTRAVGPAYVTAMNTAARTGGVPAVRTALGYADGGIIGSGRRSGGFFDDLAQGAAKVGEVLLGGLWSLAEPLVSLARRGLAAIPYANTGMGALVKAVPSKALDAIQSFFQRQDAQAPSEGFGAFSGGVGVPSWRNLIALEKASGIPFTVSSTVRPGAHDYHGTGNALDSYSSAANMVRMARYLMGYAPYLLELIHSGGGGFFVKNGRRVGASYYRSVVAGHYNHVHVAATNAGIGAALAGRGGGSGGGSGAKAVAQSMLAGFGWGLGEYPPLVQLWEHESGWNPYALNKSSGAYGIPQALPASKMASAGADWRTNPATQIRWGLGYIKGRYGSPGRAWSAWQSRSPHWYDQGGWLQPGPQLVVNGTRRPEAVLTAAQWSTLERAATGSAATGQQEPGVFTGTLTLDSGELLGTVRGEIRRSLDAEARAARHGRRAVR